MEAAGSRALVAHEGVGSLPEKIVPDQPPHDRIDIAQGAAVVSEDVVAVDRQALLHVQPLVTGNRLDEERPGSREHALRKGRL